MNKRRFNQFLISGDTLRVYKGTVLLFASRREGLLALLKYIDGFAPNYQGVVILDKVMGNAAALLSVLVNCQEVDSPLGSQLAVGTLDKYHIKYHLTEIVPYIRKPSGEDMCPMEKLSVDKYPQEFYTAVRSIISHRKKASI